MKKILAVLLLSSGIIGCSNIQLEAVSTSAEETQRILEMGLTHEENLIEASKIQSDHMASVVKLQLINAHDEKIQAEIDLVQSNKYADSVIVSNNSLNFIGPEIVKTIKKGVLETDVDIQTMHLRGNKLDNGMIDPYSYSQD
jgi:Tfp pilus assembly protein PilV